MLSKDKFNGMILGGALGDALGAPHEFIRQRKTKYTGILQYQPSSYNTFTQDETFYDIGMMIQRCRCVLSTLYLKMMNTMLKKLLCPIWNGQIAIQNFLV